MLYSQSTKFRKLALLMSSSETVKPNRLVPLIKLISILRDFLSSVSDEIARNKYKPFRCIMLPGVSIGNMSILECEASEDYG
jgi:hypothetical protein